MAAMWSGVVPQHPPMMFNQPCSAHSHSPNGSALQTDYVCAPGYEGANGGTCAQCNSSTWCMSGTANLCPAHSLAAEGSSALTSCLCVPGYFGDAVDPTPCALCLDDYYCPGGAVDLSLACPWGRYSLPGAAAASSCFAYSVADPPLAFINADA
jgi:hypothetical protein